MGGEIFAKTAKTPPLQSDVCGDGIAIRIAPKGRPLVSPCAYHAHPACLPSMGPYGLYNDAARRVATKTSRADMTMRAITTGKGGIR